MSKREPQIILKTDERGIHLELEREGKFAAKSSGWLKTGSSSRATNSRSRPRTGAGAERLAGGAAAAVEPVRHYFDTKEVTPSQAVTLSRDDVTRCGRDRQRPTATAM